jgi:uncharacterized membrane protein YeaQ/YmgE (transglycosylase-associated protein family)
VWNIIWIIIIGFIAGLIARVLSPGPNDPKGFLLTTVLGIVGAFVATFIGQASAGIGWIRALASSARRLARRSFCLSGIGSSLTALFATRAIQAGRRKEPAGR